MRTRIFMIVLFSVLLLGLPLAAGATMFDGLDAEYAFDQPAANPDFGPDYAVAASNEMMVRIVSPQHEFRMSQNETLELSGEAFDQYGALDESDLQWSSDLDGYLGAGARLDVSGLTIGVHRIELRAGDEVASIGLAVFAKAWTVLVYVCGDNNLEPYAIADVNEMEQVGSDANVNIAILFDRIPGYDSTNGNWTTTRSYYITKDTNTSTISSQMLADWGEVMMDDPLSLKAFLKQGVTAYPAAHYALIIWDHGSGWSKKEQVFKGAASDYTSGSNTELEIWEVRSAMRSALDELSMSKIDLLAYDACLMGMAEVAYEARNEVNYFVASEETEPGDGYEYQRWLANLVANPAATAANVGQYLVSAYYGTSYSTLSAADLSKLPSFVTAVNNLSTALISAVPSYKSKIKTARTKTKKYYVSDYLDLYDFCTKLKAQAVPTAVKNAATAVQTAISSYIIAKGGSATYSYGVSIWFPAAYNATLFSSYVNNSQWGYDVYWYDFLDTYY